MTGTVSRFRQAMDSIPSKKIEKKTETGGGLWAAARFWLALTLFSSIAVGISQILLATRDTLLPLVPADAVIYLHTQERLGLDLIASSSKIDLSAFSDTGEAAAYARQLNSDSELEWTVLLRWPFYAAPSQELVAKLSAANFSQIGHATFILLKVESIAAPEAGLLAKNHEVSKALASIRALARTQAYVQALNQPANNPGGPWIEAISQESFVLGLFARPNRDFTATLLPITTAADLPPFLGPGLSTITVDEPMAVLPLNQSSAAAISFSALRTDLNLLPLLFGETELARRALGIPDSDQLDTARENLNQLLAGPLSVLITSKMDLNENQEDSLVVYLPNTGPDDLKIAVSNYLKASFPRREGLQLPDQSFWPEFFAPDLSQTTPTDDLAPYKIAPLGTGTAFSDDQTLLEETISDFNRKRPVSCLGVDSFESIITNRTLIFPWSDLKLFNFSMENETKPIFIQNIGDNITHICG